VKKIAYGFAGLAMLGAVALAVAYMVWVHPWLAEPDVEPVELAERWARLEAWAQADTGCAEGGDGLRRAAEATDAGWFEVQDTVEGGYATEFALDRDELPFELRAAVDGLVDWHRTHDGLGREVCDDSTDLLDLLNLTRLTLATADGAEDEQVAAVLALGQLLRNCGPLLDTMVGLSLAEEAVRWASARGIPADATFERYRPTVDEIFGGLAREAVCSHRMVEDALRGGGLGPTAPDSPPGAELLLRPDRELRMLQLYHVERLEAADAAGRDPAALIEAFAWEEPDDLPRSLVVRIATPSGYVAEALVERLATYDAFLAGAPLPR
jgi:hypothetical protein